MASTSLQLILGASDRTAPAFNKVENRTKSLNSFLKKSALGLGAYFSARAIVGGLKEVVSAASDAEESGAKFGQVFGTAARSAEQALSVFGRTAGRSREELKTMAGDFQALIKPMGLADEQAGAMSVAMTRLTSDLASFFNTSDDQAATALRAGLVGESEPLRKYGVQLSAARIEQEILTTGMAKTKAEITSAMKAQASFNIIMRDTTQAQGDAIRTADGFANTSRRFAGAVLDAKVAVGELLLPAITSVTSAMAKMLAQTVEVTRAYGGAAEAARTFALA